MASDRQSDLNSVRTLESQVFYLEEEVRDLEKQVSKLERIREATDVILIKMLKKEMKQINKQIDGLSASQTDIKRKLEKKLLKLDTLLFSLEL
jgi:predicted  nucleic acid-binding Zn-ribbon protein